LQRFFQVIDNSPIGRAVAKRRKLLEATGQPSKIYVENVRAFFGVPASVAKWMCDRAVSEGFFERCTVFLCPNDQRVLFEQCDGEPPRELTCTVCEALELSDTFDARECKQMTFYRLRKTREPQLAQ
jgi:hypothetical protein